MNRMKWAREEKERRLEPKFVNRTPGAFALKRSQQGDHGGSISARVKASRRNPPPITLAGKGNRDADA